MLIQFSVENFLSFDEEQVFSMVATNDDQHPKHLLPDTPRKGEAVLRGAALYGANGAGKSNLVEAIRFAQRLILEGTRGRQAVPFRPFKLKSSAGIPSKFEFVIQTRGVLYNYGFRADAQRIHDEWLFATPKKQEVLFFQRATSEDGDVKVEFGPSFLGRGAKQKQFLEFVAKGTRQNQLFLTETVDRSVSKIEPVFDWFENILLVLSAETRPINLEISAHESKVFTEFLASLLRNAGTGVDDVVTKEIPFDIDTDIPDMPESQRNEAKERFSTLEGDVVIEIEGTNGRRYLVTKGNQGELIRVLLRMQHRHQTGEYVTFTMDEESEGTQRLIHLAPALFMLKRDSAKVLILDELDRRLHTQLSRLLVQMALNCDDEHRQSQLIFTTHDTNLLDLDVLRRDEIWFVEKDKGGASHLYSLAEYKIRPDLKIEKGYLNGRFGAIPFLGDIRCLGLQEEPADATTIESDQPAQVPQAA